MNENLTDAQAKRVSNLTLDYVAMHFAAKNGCMVNSAYVVEYLKGLKEVELDTSVLVAQPIERRSDWIGTQDALHPGYVKPTTGAKMPCGACVTNVYEAYEAGKQAALQADRQPDQRPVAVFKTGGEGARSWHKFELLSLGTTTDQIKDGELLYRADASVRSAALQADEAKGKDAERLDYIEGKAIRGSTYCNVTSLDIIVHVEDLLGGLRHAIDCAMERERRRNAAAIAAQSPASDSKDGE